MEKSKDLGFETELTVSGRLEILCYLAYVTIQWTRVLTGLGKISESLKYQGFKNNKLGRHSNVRTRSITYLVWMTFWYISDSYNDYEWNSLNKLTSIFINNQMNKVSLLEQSDFNIYFTAR